VCNSRRKQPATPDRWRFTRSAGRSPENPGPRCDAQRLGDRLGALFEVQPENRSAQGPHGQSAALGVKVDFGSVGPSVGDHFCGLRHVAAESPDVLFGEDWLQRAPTWKPSLVNEVEQVLPQQLPHFPMNDVLVDERVFASEDVVGRLRRRG
jgi:hypothetical protein